MTEIVGIVLVKNEDIYIGRVLTNIVQFCDRVIVADNCSRDDTPEIVEKICSQNDKIAYNVIKKTSYSHDLISDYANKDAWIFAVDGDEIYDPKGLYLFRKQLLDGFYDQYWMIFGNVLNCISLSSDFTSARGYLAPPCRSMTKLYNFRAIQSWKNSSGERLHGGEIVFLPGFDKSLRCNLFEQVSWEDAAFRCLHMCFLRRSSLQKIPQEGAFLPRPNPADILSRGPLQRLTAGMRKLAGIPEKGKAEWKIEKFTRGEVLTKDVSIFFGNGENGALR